MKIRAITFFSPLTWPFDLSAVQSFGRFLKYAKTLLEDDGYEVQALQLATPPFMDLLGDPDPSLLHKFAADLEAHALKWGVDAVSIGPVMATTPRSLLMPIYSLPELIASTTIIHSSVLVGSAKTGINLAAIKASAEVIHKISRSTPAGQGNLRFATLANVAPRGPLFPGSYHDSGNPSFGLAIDTSSLTLDALAKARNLDQAQANLIRALNDQAAKIREHVETLVDDHNLHFVGIDFSLAPSIDGQQSIGAALEQLGLETFGGHGTVFAVAFLQNCIRQSAFQPTGYCRIVLPPLGDRILSQRALEQSYTLNDLLLYIAAGSNGLDIVPLPGEASIEQMAGLLLDIATLAVTLDRSLVARLLPMPGLTASDAIDESANQHFKSGVLPLKPTSAPSFFKQSYFLDLNGQ